MSAKENKALAQEDELQRAVQEVEEAASLFLTGNAAPFKERWSNRDDTTIFGGWGVYEVGWERIEPRLEWAAGRFTGGEVSYEPLAMGASGDIGYAIGIERGEARVAEGDGPAPIVLRVTHIFRREEGNW